jgi:Na+-transporting methylmalonyl-CoA/oxaloacetate decarboxylase beta subunit
MRHKLFVIAFGLVSLAVSTSIGVLLIGLLNYALADSFGRVNCLTSH